MVAESEGKHSNGLTEKKVESLHAERDQLNAMKSKTYPDEKPANHKVGSK